MTFRIPGPGGVFQTRGHCRPRPLPSPGVPGEGVVPRPFGGTGNIPVRVYPRRGKLRAAPDSSSFDASRMPSALSRGADVSYGSTSGEADLSTRHSAGHHALRTTHSNPHTLTAPRNPLAA